MQQRRVLVAAPPHGLLAVVPAHVRERCRRRSGAVGVSRDEGATWVKAGSAPGEPAALTALDEDTLIAALHDGGFAHSDDGGRTWDSGAGP